MSARKATWCRTSRRSGKKAGVEIPPGVPEYVLFAEFRADPEYHPLRTPSGRIELYSDEIARFA